jgi:3'-phosphoadenosine 5'-phosphosulfate sulfotransferase (PAPS reductase)/FAD synthetase
MKDYIVASFSGGKDSTAMVLHMIELGEHIDEVVCCDTYKEFPAMYRHIEKVKKVVEGAGIKFTMLRAEKSFDWQMFHITVNRKTSKFAHLTGRAWPTSKVRWCTCFLKVQVIEAYYKRLKSQHNVIQCIGIATDESYRLDREANQNPNHRHPLVDWGWTETDCLKYCYDNGYDWEGLYEIFRNEKTGRSRVSCWCCPLKSLSELRKLRKHFPDLWEELKDMDKRSWNQFRADYSVEDLEIRFQFEEERIGQGLSITNRDFHNQLKERLDKHHEVISPSG